MESIITEIKNRIPNANVVCMYKTGSAILCDNCRDNDIVAICDNVSFISCFFKLQELNTDVICLSKESAYKEATGHKKARGLAVALATGDNLLYGKLPFEDYSWDKYKLNVLQTEYKSFKKLSLRMARKSGVCDKSMTWTFATYFACINNTLDFTAEQRELLQKCHDGELPVSYAEELKNNIENLIEGAN